MAVAAKKPEPRAIDLEFIADFLNFDFGSGDLGQLSKGDPMFPLLYGLTSPGALETAKKIQAEVREDLLPLITDKKKVDPADAYWRLERLIGKVNKLRILPEWGVEPVDYQLGFDTRHMF